MSVTIEVDEKAGRMYATYQLPKVMPPKNWGCICHPEIQFRRPHLPCFTYCRFKRLLKGRMPARIPITAYTMFIRCDRPGAWWKAPLLKLLIVIGEWLGN